MLNKIVTCTGDNCQDFTPKKGERRNGVTKLQSFARPKPSRLDDHDRREIRFKGAFEKGFYLPSTSRKISAAV